MKPILLAGSSLLVLSSCSITQESPVHIKGLSNVLSSTASQELQRAGEEACRKAGYSNFSSNILVFPRMYPTIYGPRNPGHRPGDKEANSGYLLYFGTSQCADQG